MELVKEMCFRLRLATSAVAMACGAKSLPACSTLCAPFIDHASLGKIVVLGSVVSQLQTIVNEMPSGRGMDRKDEFQESVLHIDRHLIC